MSNLLFGGFGLLFSQFFKKTNMTQLINFDSMHPNLSITDVQGIRGISTPVQSNPPMTEMEEIKTLLVELTKKVSQIKHQLQVLQEQGKKPPLPSMATAPPAYPRPTPFGP